MPEENRKQSMKETTQVFAAAQLAPMIQQVVESGGAFPLVVTGHSMTPTMKPQRDKVFLVSPKTRQPKKKEIVLFRREDGTYVLHRIIGGDKAGRLRINGDAQNWTEWITPEQIIAVVEAVERNGKKFSCDSAKYRCYVWFWGFSRPFRPFLFRVNRLLRGRKKRRSV